jgi:hypothetical protein
VRLRREKGGIFHGIMKMVGVIKGEVTRETSQSYSDVRMEQINGRPEVVFTKDGLDYILQRPVFRDPKHERDKIDSLISRLRGEGYMVTEGPGVTTFVDARAHSARGFNVVPDAVGVYAIKPEVKPEQA